MVMNSKSQGDVHVTPEVLSFSQWRRPVGGAIGARGRQ